VSANALPLVPAAWPAGTATLSRKIALVVAGSAALAVSAHVQVPMWPVPVTMQTLVVLLLGFALGRNLAVATVVAYLAEGAVGLPVFAAGGGIHLLGGPTAGYLFGFVVAAGLTGYLAERGWHRRPELVVVGMVLGTIVIYAMGVAWLTRVLGSFDAAIAAGVTPFLWGAGLKIAIAVLALPPLARLAGVTRTD
jgi:biotin transport system substrate-specific component